MKINLLALALTMATILCFVTCEDTIVQEDKSEVAMIEHGESLTRIMGCDHVPFEEIQ